LRRNWCVGSKAAHNRKHDAEEFRFSFDIRFVAFLNRQVTEKPRAQQSDDQADQRAKHREPEGDVGDQRAMCFHEPFIFR
jgi:hypothetical protein